MTTQLTSKYNNSNNPSLLNVGRPQVRTEPSAHIWQAAEQFFLAGELIWVGNRAKYTYPLVMNYSFSCELSLKSSESKVIPSVTAEGIIMPVGTHSVVSGHSLHDIFTKLKQKTQDGVEAEFNKGRPDGDRYQLVTLLKKCSSYFVESRYAFEMVAGSFALSDVRELAEGLLKAAWTYGIKNE